MSVTSPPHASPPAAPPPPLTAAEAVPGAPADAGRPHGVPATLSSFVGRGRDLDEVHGLVRRARLVTLAGVGGVGKTRLAREVAARLGHAPDPAATAADGEALPGPVWWVELAPLPPGGDVAPALAAALGVRQPPGVDPSDAVIAALGGPATLVVLDNCEHVVDSAAALADRLLRACPRLTLLATSREALGVEGEVVWPVGGLSHPPLSRAVADAAPDAGPDAGPDADAAAAALGDFDAVRLFVDRARAVQPGFALTARTAPAVAAITARLDGLPLALELAAAQVATLGIEALAARLDDVFAVLTRGRRTALPRHRTLRALLDWSYHLLAPDERRLLARLSVFRDAFTLEQAEAVCSDGAAPDDGRGEALDVLPALGRLAEQSLVSVRDAGGEARYALLETVRQYGAALLRGTPDEARTRARHAAWAAAFVARVGPRLWSVDRRRAGAEVEAVYDDLRAALAWAGAQAAARACPAEERALHAEQALGIAGWLTWFFLSTGRWEDGRRAYADALAAARAAGVTADDDAHDPDQPAARRRALARARYLGAVVAWVDSDYPAAIARGARAVAAWEPLAGDAALPESERRDAAVWLGLALEIEAQARGMTGDLAGAVPRIDRAVAAAERAGDARHLAAVRARRAFLRLAAGDGDGAAADWAAAVATYQRIGEHWLLSLAYQGMALHALAAGDAAAAVALAAASVEAVRGEDDAWFLSRSLDTLAAALAAGRTAAARDDASDAARAAAAATLLGAAEGARRRAGVRISAYDLAGQEAAVTAARAALGAAAFDAAWRVGEALPTPEVFARAAAAPALVPAADRPPAAHAPAVGPGGPGDAAPPRARPLAPNGATAAEPALRVLAFGPLAVARGGVPLGPGELTPAKARELVLYFVLNPPRTKEQIALALWPDASEARVRNAFHVTLHHLRRILGGKDAVAFADGAYALARPAAPAGSGGAPPFDCDVDAVLAAAAAARAADRAAEAAGARGPAAVDAVLETQGAGAGALGDWRRALDRAARGTLGEGVEAGDWIVAHQDRVRAARGDGLEALARLHARRGAAGEAAAALEALAAADPLREAAHRALMACYAAAGEPARALAHYDAFAAMLAREVGAAPARETRALADAIRRAG